MEEELAAIEEDVERKRVAKNPFEEKFTSLVKLDLIVFLLLLPSGDPNRSWLFQEEECAAMDSFRREFTDMIDGLRLSL